jgi:molybdate transport system substrate-binding protein
MTVTRALLFLLLLVAPPLRAELTVLAAASLTDVGDALVEAWHARGGERVRVAYAASSTLARQIEAGAPADLFLSADVDWTDYLVARGLVDAAPAPLATNALVIVAPARDARGPLAPEALADALPARDRLAVGDPAHVPAGRYARQALEHLGLWNALAPRLARADDVRSALALVARGEAPLGIVYATDAPVADVRVVGRFPDGSHDPIVYPMAVVRGGDGPGARALAAFLAGPETDAIWRRFGFARP